MKERVNASPYLNLAIPVLAALALHGVGRELSPAERALLERAAGGATSLYSPLYLLFLQLWSSIGHNPYWLHLSGVRSGLEGDDMDQPRYAGGDQDVHNTSSAPTASRGTKTKAAFRRILSVLPAIGAALLAGTWDVGPQWDVETGLLGDAFGFRLFFEARSKRDPGFLPDGVLDQAKAPVEKVVP